ncbi:gamma-glutamyltransferase [Sphingomonas cavernae]|uniref:Glutathione hydrolase proenzyme n=1 Tax=Sphingomonas cavernae TaxID=2320861 RepID=A0A418WQQ4_9SPHN|nr:gamma-glutamyltransferase [Sphingomonas cavernae]RJF93580.1 gamma-glutamyltransferase [Sphingomonas cavernae]
MLKRVLLIFALFAIPSTAIAQGGVVSSADPRATEAGREILRAGGSATDAAMAMMLALTVVEPQSSGIGGGGFLVHHDGKAQKIETIDGRETAPRSASPDLFLDDSGKPIGYRDAFQGGHSVGVPGNIRLMADAHKRWGKLAWPRLFEPAIRLADKGYTVNATLAGRLAMIAPLWARFPDAQALYWENGKPKVQGATVKNPALASLLRRIAAEGPDAFYTGPAGKALVDAVSKAPVNAVSMTLSDLAAYKAKDRDAVCAPYRRFKVCGMGPPSSGATTVLQILGMIERFDIKAMGKDDPKAWHLIAEAMMLAYADREMYLGDPDFVKVPVAGLIDRAYLAERSKLIAPETSLAAYEPGVPPGAEPRTYAVSKEVAGTTHFVAVDGQGNVANMTSTIEGPFGSQLVASGMFLNNELTDFTFAPMLNGAPVANRVEPGKRPLSSMSPTIVYDENGKVVLALGSAGGKRIIMHITKTLIGYMDFGLSAADAIALPNIYFGGDAVMVEKDTPLAAKLPELSKLGRTAVASDLGSKVNAIEWTPQGWRGAADPRSEGTVLAE